MPLGGTFGDFCDFWVPLGVEKGSILDQKLHLFGGLIFGWISYQLFGDFGRGRRHGRVPGMHSMPLRNDMKIMHAGSAPLS